ncbi:MAG TPA: hypothetical protein VF239_07340 [Vicinamibacterales bacterium]|jgi:hypothetical protein
MAETLSISGSESLADLRTKSDSGDTYALPAVAVAKFIKRYVDDDVTAAELEEIGDVLESSEFFEYTGPGSDGVIAQVVFEFATPRISGPITKEAAARWLNLLDT